MAIAHWMLAAALLAICSAHVVHAAAADTTEGQRAYAAGRYEDARRIWAAEAEAGDPDAQLGLASLYDLGQGVTRDPVTAYNWYRRAADAGLAAAEFNVAVMLDTGDGVPRDLAEAARWYSRAATRGNHRAQYNLGQLYATGSGVPRDLDLAAAWFAAAANDLPAAAEKLAAIRRASASARGRHPAEALEGRAPETARPGASASASSGPALSQDEKKRLFQQFQASLMPKGQTVTNGAALVHGAGRE